MQISGFSGAHALVSNLKDKTAGQDIPTGLFQNILNAENPSSSNKTSSDALASISKSKYDAVKEFQDYMKMTPGERMQYAWLKQHGISKEEFDAMPADEKQKLMEQMKREIEEKIKADAVKKSHTDILV
jgi:hypothetical protein